MEIVIIFLFALAAEMAACGYTISVARGNIVLAVVCSVLISAINWGIILFLIDNRQMFAASVAGEAVGTVLAMRIATRQKV